MAPRKIKPWLASKKPPNDIIIIQHVYDEKFIQYDQLTTSIIIFLSCLLGSNNYAASPVVVGT